MIKSFQLFRNRKLKWKCHKIPFNQSNKYDDIHLRTEQFTVLLLRLFEADKKEEYFWSLCFVLWLDIHSMSIISNPNNAQFFCVDNDEFHLACLLKKNFDGKWKHVWNVEQLDDSSHSSRHVSFSQEKKNSRRFEIRTHKSFPET